MNTNYANLTNEQLEMALEILEMKNLPEDQTRIQEMKKEQNARKAYEVF